MVEGVRLAKARDTACAELPSPTEVSTEVLPRLAEVPYSNQYCVAALLGVTSPRTLAPVRYMLLAAIERATGALPTGAGVFTVVRNVNCAPVTRPN